MSGKDILWKKYCSFYEKDFDEQLEYNKKIKKEHFKRWKKTKTADHLCHDGIDNFKDIPITTYSDYPIFSKFGNIIEKRVQKNPKPKGMLYRNYYKMIERKPKRLVEEWLPSEYGACSKTTGSTGDGKWFPHTDTFMQNFRRDVLSMMTIACSDGWGTTKVEKGDIVLNMGTPIPYMNGYLIDTFPRNGFRCFPKISYTNDINDMREKIRYIINGLRRGKKIHVGAAMASTFYLFCKVLVRPDEFFKDYYESIDWGLKKVVMYLMYLKEKMNDNDVKYAKEALPLKGLGTSGLDAALYGDYLKEQFGSYPLNIYGSTELGIVMGGTPERKMDLMPNLRSNYLEFIDEDGDIHEIDELKIGETYELIGTPFHDGHIRYSQGDLLKVIDKRDDGVPLFHFESRIKNMIDIMDYFRVNERIAVQTLEKAGLRNSNRWVVTKTIGDEEKLHFIMEKDWDYDEKIAAKKILDALKETNVFVQDYLRDYRIDDPEDIIKVEYLPKGAFKRYTLMMMNQDEPLGQYNSPSIVRPEKKEIVKMLKEA